MTFYFSAQFILYFVITELILILSNSVKMKNWLLFALNFIAVIYLNKNAIYLIVTILVFQKILETKLKIKPRNQIVILTSGYLLIKFIFFKEFTALVSFLPLVIILNSVYINKKEELTKYLFVPQALAGPIDLNNESKKIKLAPKIQYKAYFKLSLGFLIISIGTLFQNYKLNIEISEAYTYGNYINDLLFCLNYFYLNFLGTCLISSAFLNRLGIYGNYYNFNKPFLTWNYKDFWKKWNITISNFFSTYVYNSLQLEIYKKIKTDNKFGIFLISHTSLLITWIYISIWHSTKETIWIWLAYNFILISISTYLTYIKNKIIKIVFWILNLNLIFIGFIILESNSLKELTSFYIRMQSFDFKQKISQIDLFYIVLSSVTLFIFQYIRYVDIISRRKILNSVTKTYLALFAMVLASIILYSNKSVFYYGQF